MEYKSYKCISHINSIVPLFNSEKYEIKLENGTKIHISPEDERLLVGYWFYAKNKEDAKRNICIFLNNEFENFPYHLHDSFISKFVDDHPIKEAENDTIPLQAIGGFYTFRVPTSEGEITITEDEEKELIEFLKKRKEKSLEKIREWFIAYYYKHGENPFSLYDDIEVIAREFMADKGFIAPAKTDVAGTIMGFAFIIKILFYIFIAVVTIMFLFSYIQLLFS